MKENRQTYKGKLSVYTGFTTLKSEFRPNLLPLSLNVFKGLQWYSVKADEFYFFSRWVDAAKKDLGIKDKDIFTNQRVINCLNSYDIKLIS